MTHKAQQQITAREWNRHHQRERKEYFQEYNKQLRALATPESKRRDAERQRLWRLRSPEKARAQQARRAHQKRGLPWEKIDKRQLYERDGGRCHLCGKRVAFEVMTLDHMVPMVRGGGYTWANLKVAHRSCNCSKGDTVVVHQMALNER